MELWIRSQNKEILSKVEHLVVYSGKIYAKGCYIGEYKTKERALEVLKEIQRHLIIINDKNSNDFYVYEMPIY